MASRDAVALTGEPDWEVKLGRLGSLTASQEDSNKSSKSRKPPIHAATFGSNLTPFSLQPLSSLSRLSSVLLQSMANRWVRPEVYPLFFAVGAAVGICGFSMVRHMCINPEVRENKQSRAAGVLENFSEGEKYTEHLLRKFSRNRSPEIMPGINGFFTDPSRN
ncbi:hypothetical protein RYX36_015050 [Vicia faba]